MRQSKPLHIQRIIDAANINLSHDGDETDFRLDADTIFTNSVEFTRNEYLRMEGDINRFRIKGRGFFVYAWNDSSGFEYWTLKQCEDNYIQITLAITSDDVDLDAMNKALDEAQSRFQKYERC